MTFLSTLKFTTEAETIHSPIERRRARLIENLQDQLIRVDDVAYAKTRSRWVKDAHGKRLIEKQIPVRPWWRSLPDGRLAFFVKTGLKKVEFKKGLTAIVVDDRTALPALTTGLISAVHDGEFDTYFKTPDEKRLAPAKRTVG